MASLQRRRRPLRAPEQDTTLTIIQDIYSIRGIKRMGLSVSGLSEKAAIFRGST
jgi:hypothetical protein